MNQYGGIGDQAGVDALSGPGAAGYELLKSRGVDLLGQAVSSNLNPVLSRAAPERDWTAIRQLRTG